MFDIWAFLLQTLTASGVAVFLLFIKRLFKDMLPPKWHFLVWSSLGLVILLPAGLFGRYTLVNWRIAVEMIKGWFGDYSFTRILFPIPILNTVPETLLEWIFAIYVFGVIFFAAKYIISYISLRLVLRKGKRPREEALEHIREIAAEHGIKLCKVIEVPGLTGAFVCGVIRPILAVPAEGELDDKIILHELFHLKHKDTFWSAAICLLRCIHWCNPLLIYCANLAINDMESRCDQYVLECLEGEELREYGRVLLSMSNERFAKTPGSTCINNGGKNIRDRIEAIARFKKYPAGMGLVSGCVILVLTVSLAVGAQASTVYENANSLQIAMASARSTPCTTYAGAFDTYAKAILDQNGVYRAMCAPASMQADIVNEMYTKDNVEPLYPNWDCGLNEWPSTHSGYYIYNLKHIDKDVYEGLLVIEVNYPPNGQAEEEDKMYLAVQNLRVEKENGRWVTIPLEDFRNITLEEQGLEWGCPELPGFTYSETASDFQIDVVVQTVCYVDSWVDTGDNTYYMFGVAPEFDTTPKPNAAFTAAQAAQFVKATHLGSEAERNGINQIGISVAPVFSGQTRPESLHAAVGTYSASSTSGEDWFSYELEPGWGPAFYQEGSGGSFNPAYDNELPEYYAANLYINNKLMAQIDLHLQEGVEE